MAIYTPEQRERAARNINLPPNQYFDEFGFVQTRPTAPAPVAPAAPANETSALGAFGANAAASVLPTLAALPGMKAGAALGAFTSPVTGPVGPIVGGIGGGLLTGLLAAFGQNKALGALSPEALEYLAKSTSEHPIASTAGSIAGAGPTWRPSLAPVRELSNQLKRRVAHGVPMNAKAGEAAIELLPPAALGAGLSAYEDVSEGRDINLLKMLTSSAGEALLNKPAPWAQKMFNVTPFTESPNLADELMGAQVAPGEFVGQLPPREGMLAKPIKGDFIEPPTTASAKTITPEPEQFELDLQNSSPKVESMEATSTANGVVDTTRKQTIFEAKKSIGAVPMKRNYLDILNNFVENYRQATIKEDSLGGVARAAYDTETRSIIVDPKYAHMQSPLHEAMHMTLDKLAGSERASDRKIFSSLSKHVEASPEFKEWANDPFLPGNRTPSDFYAGQESPNKLPMLVEEFLAEKGGWNTALAIVRRADKKSWWDVIKQVKRSMSDQTTVDDIGWTLANRFMYDPAQASKGAIGGNVLKNQPTDELDDMDSTSYENYRFKEQLARERALKAKEAQALAKETAPKNKEEAVKAAEEKDIFAVGRLLVDLKKGFGENQELVGRLSSHQLTARDMADLKSAALEVKRRSPVLSALLKEPIYNVRSEEVKSMIAEAIPEMIVDSQLGRVTKAKAARVRKIVDRVYGEGMYDAVANVGKATTDGQRKQPMESNYEMPNDYREELKRDPAAQIKKTFDPLFNKKYTPEEWTKIKEAGFDTIRGKLRRAADDYIFDIFGSSEFSAYELVKITKAFDEYVGFDKHNKSVFDLYQPLVILKPDSIPAELKGLTDYTVFEITRGKKPLDLFLNYMSFLLDEEGNEDRVKRLFPILFPSFRKNKAIEYLKIEQSNDGIMTDDPTMSDFYDTKYFANLFIGNRTLNAVYAKKNLWENIHKTKLRFGGPNNTVIDVPLSEIVYTMSSGDWRILHGNKQWPNMTDIKEAARKSYERQLLGDKAPYPDAPFKDVADVKRITNVEELEATKNKYQNCLSNYAPEALRGECFIYDTGNAAIELREDGGLVQHLGLHNAQPSEVDMQRLLRFAEENEKIYLSANAWRPTKEIYENTIIGERAQKRLGNRNQPIEEDHIFARVLDDNMGERKAAEYREAFAAARDSGFAPLFVHQYETTRERLRDELTSYLFPETTGPEAVTPRANLKSNFDELFQEAVGGRDAAKSAPPNLKEVDAKRGGDKSLAEFLGSRKQPVELDEAGNPRGRNVGEFGDLLAATATRDNKYGKLAAELLPFVDESRWSKRVYVNENIDTSYYHMMTENTRKGYVVLEPTVKEGTIVHEGLHVMTSDIIREELGPWADFARGAHYHKIVRNYAEAGPNEAVRDIAKLYLHVIDKTGASELMFHPKKGAANKDYDTSEILYGIRDLHEFVAEAYTSKQFQHLLKQMPSPLGKGKTTWDSFVAAVKRALGIESIQNSVLDDVFDASHSIMRQKEPKTPAGSAQVRKQPLEAKSEEPKPGTLLSFPRLDGWLESRIKTVAKQGDSGQYVADSAERYYAKREFYEGTYANRAAMFFDGYKPEKGREEAMVRWLHDIRHKGRSNVKLTDQEQHIAMLWKEHLFEIGQKHIDIGMLVKEGKDQFRTMEQDPNYSPDMVSPDIVHYMTTHRASADAKAKKLREDFIDWAMQKSEFEKESDAIQYYNDYMDAVSGVRDLSGSNDRAYFSALRRAKGIGLPYSWVEKNPLRLFYRYGKRVAHDFSFFEEIQGDPVARWILGVVDQEGNKPMEVPMDSLSDMPEVQTMAHGIILGDQPYYGGDRIRHARIMAAARVVANSIMGVGTGLRDIVTLPGTMAPYITKFGDLKSIFKGARKMFEVRKRALQAGATQLDYDSFQYGDLEYAAPDKTVARLSKLSSGLRKWGGRQALENWSRQLTFAIGEEIATTKLAQANAGDKAASEWLLKFSKSVDDTDAKDTIQRVAKEFTDRVQGSYDARNLPSVAIEGEVAPFLNLARWSIEKYNVVKEDVFKPLTEKGDMLPLLRYTFGSFLAGAAIEKLNEALSNKRGHDATIKEVLNSPDAGVDDYIYKIISLGQLGAFAGIAGDATKLMAAGMSGETAYNNPLSFPLYTFMTDTLGQNVADASEAIQQGEDPVSVLAGLVHAIGMGGNQNYRYATAYLDNKGTKRKEKFRDLAVWKRINDEAVALKEIRSNRFLKEEERKFKQEDDAKKAVAQLPSLIEDAIKRSKGDPYKLKAELRSLKGNSYQTFPNPDNMPMAFRKYLLHLEATQGPEAAREKLLDWARQQQVNKAKTSAIPSF